jgi:hypothetical protein
VPPKTQFVEREAAECDRAAEEESYGYQARNNPVSVYVNQYWMADHAPTGSSR